MTNWNFTCHDRGLILPLINEGDWSDGFRAALYFIAMIYSFLGIAIAADVFMCAIEKITSATRKVPIKASEQNPEDAEQSSSDSQFREVPIWNPTVANLTLMALGSSSPEILLSIIEIVGNNFKAGELGPGCIVGSAAYNLLGITAICIATIPNGVTRRIQQYMVFIVTSAFATFAYLWLIIILIGISPGVVEVWEGLLTLLFMAALVIVSYVTDRQLLCKRKPAPGAKEEIDLDAEAIQPLQELTEPYVYWREKSHREKIWDRMLREYPDLDAEALAQIVATRLEAMRPHDQLYYRIRASRYLGGSIRSMSSVEEEQQTVAKLKPQVSKTVSQQSLSTMGKSKIGFVEFAAKIYAIKPEQRVVTLKAIRRGRLHKRILVRYDTVNGSAKKMEHFLPKSDILVFDSGDESKSIQVEIAEGSKWTEHQAFFVRLHIEEGDEKTHLGSCSNAKIRYQTAAESPQIGFESMNVAVKESTGEVRIPIKRHGNFDNQVVAKWTTKEETATEGKDYRGGPGTTVFEPNEVSKFVDIEIIDDKEVEKSETFQVNLTECEGAKLGDYRTTIVTIVSDDSTREKIAQLNRYVPLFLKSLHPGTRTWWDQFMSAVSVNGGDTTNARFSDVICHILAFPWKVLFAFVPPPIFLGGWLTFCIALILIGILTAIVGDLAAIFGCLVGLKDVVTSITFVAMGTSLPDTFASRVAALQDPTADNAIGNVTGSNSVNVFLGLGLPWFIAACYWAAKGGTFEVPPGSLGFSVLIYTIVSVFCLVLLFLRRRLKFFGEAECGGPALPKYASAIFLVLLWFVYILLSALQAYEYIPGF